MKSDRRWPVAIVGGGFSGTMLAAQLARRGIGSALIEGSGREGLGTAYSTEEPAHLLNVRAGEMSAWPDKPGDFAGVAGDPRTFAERRLFGRYLRAILEQAMASGLVSVVGAGAVGATRDDCGWTVELDDGDRLAAEALALANGNQPPEPLRAAAGAGDRVVNNPWSAAASQAIGQAAAEGGDVLIVGTGLTMVDMVLSLDAAGHRGRIVALSRRGLVPRGHAEFAPAPVDLDKVPSGDLMALWRWLRRRSGEIGFHAAVDGLRPHSHALWQALDRDQQRRFLRHARPWWDVHRHRIAPQVAGRLADLAREGRLEVVAGRIASIEQLGQEVAVKVRARRQSCVRHQVRFVFNCTGPLGAIGNSRDRLLRSLLERGCIRPDALGIGLDVDRRSLAGQRLWALGPLTKGRYWEIVAVPDISGQAAAVAEDMARELRA